MPLYQQQVPGQRLGANTNTQPATGMVGERLFTSVSSGAPVNLTTGDAITIMTLSLTPGIWDVFFEACYAPDASTNVTQMFMTPSTTTNALGSDGYIFRNASGFVPGNNIIPAWGGPLRRSVATTTDYFLVARADFTVSTIGAFGQFFAIRVN